jgi:hypothetical protein
MAQRIHEHAVRGGPSITSSLIPERRPGVEADRPSRVARRWVVARRRGRRRSIVRDDPQQRRLGGHRHLGRLRRPQHPEHAAARLITGRVDFDAVVEKLTAPTGRSSDRSPPCTGSSPWTPCVLTRSGHRWHSTRAPAPGRSPRAPSRRPIGLPAPGPPASRSGPGPKRGSCRCRRAQPARAIAAAARPGAPSGQTGRSTCGGGQARGVCRRSAAGKA